MVELVHGNFEKLEDHRLCDLTKRPEPKSTGYTLTNFYQKSAGFISEFCVEESICTPILDHSTENLPTRVS